MNDVRNPELELAYDFLSTTNRNVYLTGKAGTGKTTFLRRIQKELYKRVVVVAPTGVAAINAGGVTIHSLFQLPFGPMVPGRKLSPGLAHKISKRKIDLLKSIDVLVIDEISMVRADVLDAIDDVLKRYKNKHLPFGGTQLLLIGDLHQLPPVVKSQEWEMLRPYYKTLYFFGSRALEHAPLVHIELKHIYRQSDREFIDLLNQVRNNESSEELFAKLNQRYLPDFEIKDGDGYITLTSHNATANKINSEQLKKLKGKSRSFVAKIEGDFPEQAYPTGFELSFKVGAQVMFVKNDSSEEKLYYNGKIGTITRMDDESIWVKGQDDFEEIEVSPEEWDNRKYSLEKESGEVVDEVIGSFVQMPLKLAWAITIHKSQGLTFEKVVIDAKDAFAHGQVYVALSRCKSFEGIVLRSPLGSTSIRTDAVIQKFTSDALANEPDLDDLTQAQFRFQGDVLRSYFSMKEAGYALKRYERAILENQGKLHGNQTEQVKELEKRMREKVLVVGQTFVRVLDSYLAGDFLPENNNELTDRLKKGGAYFSAELSMLLGTLKSIQTLTDNKEVEKAVFEQKMSLEKELSVLFAGAQELTKRFESSSFMRALIDADVNFNPGKVKSAKKVVVPENMENKKLYETLVSWRLNWAQQEGIPAYRVLTTKSIVELVKVLPMDKEHLDAIGGIGPHKMKTFGQSILEMIVEYCEDHELEGNRIEFASGKKKKKKAKVKPKVDSKKLSYDLFKAGKSPAEIAQERGLVRSTIEGHLAYYIAKGDLELTDVVDSEAAEEILSYFKTANSISLNEAREHFKNKYDFGVLKMVRAVRFGED